MIRFPTINFGRGGAGSDPAPAATVAFVGDSLTDPSYNVTPWYWALGVAGGVLAPIINAGVSGNTIANVLSRIDNAYTNASPGLASAPETLGWVFLRIGTNDARAGAIGGTAQANFDSLLAKCLTYASKVVVFAIPPLGGAEAAHNANVGGYNSYFSSKANGSTVFFIDGTASLYTGANQNSAYFSDGIHFNSSGTYQGGIDEGAALATLLSPYGYASPVDSAAASSTTQWHPNPQNTGTGGSNSTGGGGSVPSSLTLSSAGSGNVAATSIVATSDSNPTSWLRITPSALGAAGSGAGLMLSATGAGRSITSGDPAVLDVVLQLRFNALDASHINEIRVWMQDGSGGKMVSAGLSTGYLQLLMGGSTVTQDAVLRYKLKRPTSNTSGSSAIYVVLISAGSFSGSMGSLDLRCFTIKG